MTGRCTRESGCKTECQTSSLRMFCPHWNAEHAAGEHEAQGVAMWWSLPDDMRKRALDHLRTVLANHHVALTTWRDQAKRGVAIGSDDIRFHYAGGMAVRNVLREVVPDDELPLIVEDKAIGPRDGNWDDFYYGALDTLVREDEHAEAKAA